MIQSIERAFDILKVVSNFPEGISTGQIAQMTDLHPSTVSRIVSTLERLEALERSEGTKVILGQGIHTLTHKAPWTEKLIRIAQPILQELATETGEAVGLTQIRDGICEIFYQIQGEHLVAIKDWTGLSFPMHVTSTGKLYLSTLKNNELNEYLKRPLVKLASKSIHKASSLKAEVKALRGATFVWTIDELEDGLASIAASIFNATGDFQAGLYLSMPSYRMTKTFKKKLENLIPKAAEDITTQFSVNSHTSVL